MIARPRYLMLVHRVPYPPNRGDRIRSFHLLNHLSQQGDVYLATLSDEPVPPSTMSALRSRCTNVAVERVGVFRWARALASLAAGKSATAGLFKSPRLSATIQKWADTVDFDAIVIFCSSMVQYVQIPALKGVRTIVDLVDVDSRKFFDYAETSGKVKRLLYRTEGHRLQLIEHSLPAFASAITLVTEAESQIYRDICPNDKTHTVNNGVDLAYFAPQTVELKRHRLAFVGVLDYPPNVDAVCWFCETVWPRVRSLFPNATFSIIGRNPTTSVRKLNALPGVNVHASVPDVRPYLAEAEVVVVPLRIARGVQNKVLEAMAMQKPTIVSPPALEGISAVPGHDLLCARTADEWLSHITRLLSDVCYAESIAKAGREFVEAEHDWDHCLNAFDGLLTPASNHHILSQISEQQ